VKKYLAPTVLITLSSGAPKLQARQARMHQLSDVLPLALIDVDASPLLQSYGCARI
jgi:hypothetical protein